MAADRGKQPTFLQRLGFEDDDLRSPEHDQMSFFLADPANFRKIAEDSGLVLHEFFNSSHIPDNYWELGKVSLEHPITKGKDQYSTIIGYGDAFYGISRPSILIEAKTKLQNPMETLRQINTYRQFFSGPVILWFPGIDEKTASIFRSQGIFVSNFKI